MSTLPTNLELFGAKMQKLWPKNILASMVWHQNSIGVFCSHPETEKLQLSSFLSMIYWLEAMISIILYVSRWLWKATSKS